MFDKSYDLTKYYNQLRANAEKKSEAAKVLLYSQYPELKEIDTNIKKSYVKLALASSDNDTKKVDEINKLIKNLEEDKLKFINKNKIDISVLTPKYKCSKCNDTGYVDGKICDCYIEELERLRPEPFLFSKYDINKIDYTFYDENQIADDGTNYREFLKQEISSMKSDIDKMSHNKLTHNKIEPLNCILIGNEATGKTFILNCFARYIFLYTPFSISFVKAHDCIRSIMNKDDQSEFHDKIESPDFLFIDDLGRENKTEFSMCVLSDLIDYRLKYMKNTFIASSLSLKSINEIYGEYVYNRIFDYNYSINLKGSL